MDQQEVNKVFSSKGWDIILQSLEDHHIGLLSAQESVKDPNDALAKVKIIEGFGQALSLLFRLSSRGEKENGAALENCETKVTSKEGEGEKKEEKVIEKGEGEKQEKQSQSKNTPTGTEGEGEGETQSPFKDTRLVGKSEAEIADKILLLETVVKEQGSRLNEVYRKEEVNPGPGEGEKVKEETIEPADYYKDPVSVTEKIVQKAIKEQMTESIRPFMEDLRVNKSGRVLGITLGTCQGSMILGQLLNFIYNALGLQKLMQRLSKEHMILLEGK